MNTDKHGYFQTLIPVAAELTRLKSKENQNHSTTVVVFYPSSAGLNRGFDFVSL
jgi:hypothetical protein